MYVCSASVFIVAEEHCGHEPRTVLICITTVVHERKDEPDFVRSSPRQGHCSVHRQLPCKIEISEVEVVHFIAEGYLHNSLVETKSVSARKYASDARLNTHHRNSSLKFEPYHSLRVMTRLTGWQSACIHQIPSIFLEFLVGSIQR